MPTTITRQPSETYTLAINYSGKLPSGSALSSGEWFASEVTTLTTTLAAAALAGATGLSVVANVGQGARLTVGSGSTAEVVKVSSVGGLGPYQAAIRPGLTYAHATAAVVTYEPGVSADLLGSTTAKIIGTQARGLLQGGVHGHTYRLSVMVTLDTNEVLEDEVIQACRDR